MVDKDLQNNSNGNKFVKVIKMFLQFLKNICYDFVTSFKYNKMKLPGYLIAIPGIFIGFFLSSHVNTLGVMVLGEKGEENYAGIFLFILMLFGILNIFVSVSVMGKKNLGSVIISAITSLFIVGFGAVYLWNFFYSRELLTSGAINLNNYDATMTTDNYISIIFVMISMLSCTIGVVLGFIFYDRTYEKVKR